MFVILNRMQRLSSFAALSKYDVPLIVLITVKCAVRSYVGRSSSGSGVPSVS